MFSRGLVVLLGVVMLGFAQVVPIQPPSKARITTISPTQGPIAGGTILTISGSGFSNASVTIDLVGVTPVSRSDSSIELRMAAHDSGYVAIGITTPDGATAYQRYLYVPPRLDEIPPGYITTVAGVGYFKGDFGPASEAMVAPNNLVFDSRGNLYIAECEFDEISRIRALDGVFERYAGSGAAPNASSCCGDNGAASRASINFARGITIDSSDTLFIADRDHNRIRRVDTVTHVITTVAGTGARGFSGDGGPATSARLGYPTYITKSGDDLYFLDFDAVRIRKVDRTGTINTVAGNGTTGFSGDGGPATQASFNLTFDPDQSGLAADSSGNLFLIDNGNRRIRRIDTRSGIVTTFAELPTQPSDPRHAGSSVFSVATDRDGNVYYAAQRIVKLSPSGALLQSWGTTPADFSPDGTALDGLRFGLITGMTFDADGNLVYGDQSVRQIRRMNFKSSQLETLAGMSPGIIGDEGPAIGAVLYGHDADLAFTPSGELLIADSRVRRVDRDGKISTIAGRALGVGAGQSRDNVPAIDSFNGALALYVGPTGEIDTASFLSPPYHIDGRGIATLLVGRTKECGYAGDNGPARAVGALLCQPWGLARDRAGNLFIADTNNNRVRRVDARTGTLTTFAGTGPVNGFENYRGSGLFCGDGGPAAEACFNTPYSIAFDPEGNLFVSDSNNRRIRRIDGVTNTVTTFAQLPTTGRGATTIRFDNHGRLYAHLGNRFVRFDREGRMQVIAGTPQREGFGGDGGPALEATVNGLGGQSSGIAIDNQGNVFFYDPGNRRVRAIRGPVP